MSTRLFNTGTFYVQPGGWFDSGNHPDPEPYYILKGTLHLSNPDTGDVVELNAGDASNIPAFAYHHAFNFGDEAAHILWWVPGEMHTDEFKRKVSDNPLGRLALVRAHRRDVQRPDRAPGGLPLATRRAHLMALDESQERRVRHDEARALDVDPYACRAPIRATWC